MSRIIDKDIAVMMGSLLRIGVILSASIVLIGGFFFLIKYGTQFPQYHKFNGEPTDLTNIKGIFTGLMRFHSRAIIQFGIIILIATPIARVLLSIVGFMLEKDYLYVLITLIVLGVICFSIFSGSIV